MLMTTFLMGAVLALPAAPAVHAAPEPVPVTSAGLHALIREGKAPYTLVNLWASWCLPCREEFPALLEAREKLRGKGLRLMLVTMDFESAMPLARKFLREKRIDFATWRKGEKEQAFMAGLSAEWSGLLPTSILFDADGKVLRTWEGPISYDFIASELDSLEKEHETP